MIVIGDATEGTQTGLAGHFATRLKGVFPAIRFPAGSLQVKLVNALAGAVVDALNNEKVSTSSQTTP
jgi:hypothetical protein